MRENHNIPNPRRQDIGKNITSFIGGAITISLIALFAEKMGYARINFGKHPIIPYEQLKEFTIKSGINIMKYCQENIDAKDVAKVLEKIAPKL